MNKTIKVLIYVQHLLGMGHVFRVVRFSHGLRRAGCEVHIAWGGSKVFTLDTTGLHMHYLQAVHVADEDFKTLLLDDGTQITDAQKEARAHHLLSLYHDIKPDIVITEAFPFGRRQMRFELLPLMEAIQASDPKPLLAASIRDIMQENRVEKRVRESIESIHNWYDLVLVHGDPNLIPIEATLQGADEIKDKIRYTGLVTPDPVDLSQDPEVIADVLVSAGGGAVGKNLMFCAIQSMHYCKTFPKNWALVTGPSLSDGNFQKLVEQAPEGMRIIRSVSNLLRCMAAAKVSVSLAGYNTAGDILRCTRPALLVPFSGGLETEQSRRAQLLADRNIANCLDEDTLTPEILAQAIDKTASLPAPSLDVDREGASNTASILLSELEAYQSNSSNQ